VLWQECISNFVFLSLYCRLKNILSLTAGDPSSLNNFTSTPTVFTFVTTSTNWDRRRDSTTTVYTGDLSSTFSTYSLSSRGSSPMPTASASGDPGCSHYKDLHLDFMKVQKCETPQNTPQGNSRPGSPSTAQSKDSTNRSFGSKCLFLSLSITHYFCFWRQGSKCRKLYLSNTMVLILPYSTGLYNMYDSLITKLGRLGGKPSPSSEFIKQKVCTLAAET
jgi:hypothetical protein